MLIFGPPLKSNLVCSFDGSCYIKQNSNNLNTKCWTHTDQAQQKDSNVIKVCFIN